MRKVLWAVSLRRARHHRVCREGPVACARSRTRGMPGVAVARLCDLRRSGERRDGGFQNRRRASQRAPAEHNLEWTWEIH